MKFNKLAQFNKSEEFDESMTKEVQWEPKTVEMEEGFAEKMAASLGRRQVQESTEQIDEISLKTAINTHTQRLKNEYEDDGGNYKGSDDIYGKIAKKFGKKGTDAADKAGYAGILGREDEHLGHGKYNPGDKLKKPFMFNPRTNKNGTMNKQDSGYLGRTIKGRIGTHGKSHLPEGVELDEGYDDSMDPEMIGFKQTAGEKRLGAKRKQQQDRAEKTAAVTRTVKRSSGVDHSDSDVSEPEATKKDFKVGAGLKHAAPSWLSPKPVAPVGGKKIERGVTTKQEVKPVSNERIQALQSRLDRLPKKHPDRTKIEKQLARLKEDVELDESNTHRIGDTVKFTSSKDGKGNGTIGGRIINIGKDGTHYIQSNNTDMVHQVTPKQIITNYRLQAMKEEIELDEMAKDTTFGSDQQMKIGADEPKKQYSIKDRITGQIKRTFKTMKDAVAHHISMPAHLKSQHQVVFAEEYEINPIDWFRVEVIHEGQSAVFTIAELEEGEMRNQLTDTMRKQRGFINASAFFKMSKDKQKEHLMNVAGKSEEEAERLITPKKGRK